MSSENIAATQFGRPVDEIIKAQHARGIKADVPSVVSGIISWLESNQASSTPNIFRALGHAPTVVQIKQEIEGGTWNAANYQKSDMNNIATIMKVFLRELPESLFPSQYYSIMMKIIKETSDPTKQAYQLRACVYCIPKSNRDTILFISNFLNRVAANHNENGIDAATLAGIFAPYIFRPAAEKVYIPADKDYITTILKRFIEEAPFFVKAVPRPHGTPEGTSGPSSSCIQGRALYPYPGGSKWLLPLQKDDVVTVLDIKNEEGWVKVSMRGEVGYSPLSYVQLMPLPEPTDDPRTRVPLPSEYEEVREVAPSPRFITSPHLAHMSPEPSHFPSPTLSHITHLPPPPPLDSPVPLYSSLTAPPSLPSLSLPLPTMPPPLPPTTSLPPPPSIPPPLTSSSLQPPPPLTTPPLTSESMPAHLHLPPPLSPSLSNSASNGIPPSFSGSSSPRFGLSNSTPILPAVPPNLLRSPSKSSEIYSAPNSPQHHLPMRTLTRAPSHSAPPPRLVAPQLPLELRSPESERASEDDNSTDYETEPEENETVTKVVPPPAPALPPVLAINLMPTSGQEDAVSAKKRKDRAEETLATERTYVKQLTAVVEFFVEPLKKKEKEKTPILAGTDISAIFSNIEVILNCHKKLLEMMEARMLEWDSVPELGDIFWENTGFIKLYKHYVNNFDKSISTLKSVREKNAAFKEYAQEYDYTEKLSMLSIESFLILPVQRIPRYVLLLQDLLKYTNPSHSDFNNLTNALSFIKDLADFINSNKSDADNINKIMSIQDILIDLPDDDFTLIVPRRRFIDEGTIIYKKQKAYVYLFSDALLFTKIEKKGNKYKALINLPTASLNTNDEPGVLKIISTEGTFRFSTETPKDRDRWTKIIRETMDASRIEMLHSVFTDGNQTEGSNKQFLKHREEENALKKKNLVDRLCISESQYMDALKYLQGTFLAPLRKAVDAPMPMISLAEFIDISSNLETLLHCHQIFLQAIKERVVEWNDKPYVYDLFSEKAAFLKLYNHYVSNHHMSLETIDACIEKYPLFAVFLRELEAREKNELKVLLTEPLRRVSTYYLIVQEMSQYIKPKTEEFEQVMKNVSRLKEQTEKLNHDLHAGAGIGIAQKRIKANTVLERGTSKRKFRITKDKESK